MNTLQLKQAIVAVTHRDDYLASRAQFFIDRCADMIASDVRALQMVATDTLDDSDRSGTTSAVYTLPADYLEKRALLGRYGATEYKVRTVSLGELRYYATTAPPYWGAFYGSSVELRGIPGAGVSFQLIYFARPAALSADGDTNALLTAAGDLYLHGALYWAYLEEQAVELARLHRNEFDSIARRLNIAAARAQVSGAVSIETLPTGGGY